MKKLIFIFNNTNKIPMSINSTLKKILGLNQDDMVQLQNNFPDLNYINQTTGNNVLHIISFLKSLFKKCEPKIQEILDFNLIDINATNLEGRNCLMTGMKACNYEFVLYILSHCDNIDFNLKDNKGNTLFFWACSRGDIDIIIALLEKGCHYDMGDIASIADDNMRDKVTQILFGNAVHIKYNSNNDELQEESDFKFYGEDDFIFNQRDEIGKGSYGSAIVAVEKITGKKCVIKRFSSQKNLFMEDSVLRDIIYLRELKKKKHAVQIYGVFIDKNNNLYMVMEFLSRTVSDQMKIISTLKDKNERIKQYKKLIYESLICIDGNSRVGFIHCDTKGDNIMVNNQGVVKYIDYGFSYFLGISPLKSNINHPVHSGSYLLQDGSREDKVIKVTNDKKRFFNINYGYLGYNLDIGSLGLMFIHQMVGYSAVERCTYHDGKLYKHLKSNGPSEMSCLEYNDGINLLKQKYGDELTDLICKMIEIDSLLRPTAKELLHDPIFEDLPTTYPKNLNITNLDNTVSNDIIRTAFNEYNTITQKSYIRGGFIYFDDIISHWSSKKCKLIKEVDNDFIHVIDKLTKFFKKSRICIDAFFNTIFYIYSCIDRYNNGIQPPFTLQDFYNNEIILYIILINYSNTYEDLSFNEYSFFNIVDSLNRGDNLPIKSQQEKNRIKTEIHKINDKLKRDIDFYNMYPVMLYIGYIKFILQVVCNDKNKITNLICGTIDNFKSLITNGQLDDGQYNIFEMVKYSYYNCIDPIDILMNPGQIKCEDA